MNKYMKVLACVIIIGIIILLIVTNGFQSSANSILADTGTVVQDAGECPAKNDPINVCINYSSCCPADDPDKKCICSDKSINKCQEVYKSCLKGDYLTGDSMAYIGADNKAALCSKLLAGCCSAVNTKSSNGDKSMQEVKMQMADVNAVPLCHYAGENENDTIQRCKSRCFEEGERCSSIIYDSITGRCDLYDKPLIDKPGFMHASKVNEQTRQFQKHGKQVEGFESSPEIYKNYCIADVGGEDGSDSVTIGGLAKCMAGNSIVADCASQRDKCVKSGGSTKMCGAIYGACCGLMDSVNWDARFKFEADKGYGIYKNMICSPTVDNTADCKKLCAANPNCNYISSNLFAAPGNNSAALGNASSKYCKLYTGSPAKSPLVGASFTAAANNPPEPIFIKKIVDEDAEIGLNSA